jgi:hypothetical protein
LFSAPTARQSAIEALENVLQRNELSVFLSPDLLEICRAVHTPAIRRVIQALDAEGEIEARLHKAWKASAPEHRDLIRFEGTRLTVEGSYEISRSVNYNSPRIAPEPEKCVDAELWVEYWIFTGWLVSRVGESFALVLHALLHDFVADKRDGSSKPIYWCLAMAGRSDTSYTAWPAVQWPARFDMQLQLRSWQLDCERRKQPEFESLSARVRFFISSTVQIFKERTLHDRSVGSWTDVISEAWTAKKTAENPKFARSQAYTSWVEQIPRFALPRVGLSHVHAADILVRYIDITKLDVRGQLKGRLKKAGEKMLAFDAKSFEDHPAVLIASCKTDEQLEETIASLRDRYELS